MYRRLERRLRLEYIEVKEGVAPIAGCKLCHLGQRGSEIVALLGEAAALYSAAITPIVANDRIRLKRSSSITPTPLLYASRAKMPMNPYDTAETTISRLPFIC